MNRRSFFSVLLGLPVVGVAALLKSTKDKNAPDHVLEGNVLIRGGLAVEGIETGTALIAGDCNVPMVNSTAAWYVKGASRSQPKPANGFIAT